MQQFSLSQRATKDDMDGLKGDMDGLKGDMDSLIIEIKGDMNGLKAYMEAMMNVGMEGWKDWKSCCKKHSQVVTN